MSSAFNAVGATFQVLARSCERLLLSAVKVVYQSLDASALGPKFT
jgi:hypothetical protein